MSDLRTAAQQALEAFDPKNGHPEHMWPFHVKGLQAQACKALRAALAEPEPFQPDWDRVEALQESLREHMEEVRQLRAALAAAVAEERERCATLVEDTQRQYPGDGLDGWLLAHEMRSYAAAALAAAVAEPVAWVRQDWSGTGQRSVSFDGPPDTPSVRDGLVNPVWTPLYAAPAAPPQREPYDQTALGLCNACGWKAVGPDGCLNCAPQREPLTDEQIYEIYNEPRSDAEMVEFARAIERAHGIAPASAPKEQA